MWQYLFAILAFGSLLSVVIVLASKHASKEAQLQNLKAELKKQAEEQERARRIMDQVSYMSNDDARRKLCELQIKQR